MSDLEIKKKDGSSFRFLCVDDSDFILKAMAATVKLLGGEVVAVAHDGVEAIEQYRKFRPDVVTCDIVMPNMGGVDVVRELVNMDPEAKVIMASSLGHGEVVREAITAGAKYFIVKPFKPADAAAKIRAVLEKLFPVQTAA